MNFKSAFWQIELEPKSRYVTVFHANDKLHRYKRLTTGLKSSQGELNAAFLPLFSHIPNAHLIHDDLILLLWVMKTTIKLLNYACRPSLRWV